MSDFEKIYIYRLRGICLADGQFCVLLESCLRSVRFVVGISAGILLRDLDSIFSHLFSAWAFVDSFKKAVANSVKIAVSNIIYPNKVIYRYGT